MRVITIRWKMLKKLAKYLTAALLVLAVASLGMMFSQEVVTTAAGQKLKPVYKVETEDKKIAISFDACWGVEFTDDILEILARYKIKTTFFLVNIWLDKYPEQAREIAEYGHEIGLHSATHPHFSTLSREHMEQELRQNFNAIKDITGYEPVLFRPPFGDYNDRIIEVSRSMGFEVIQWSIDSLDWKDLSAKEIYQRVVDRASPGDIVLFHNNGRYTAQALVPILETLTQEGYDIVGVSELLHKGDYYVDHQGVQHPGRPE